MLNGHSMDPMNCNPSDLQHPLTVGADLGVDEESVMGPIFAKVTYRPEIVTPVGKLLQRIPTPQQRIHAKLKLGTE